MDARNPASLELIGDVYSTLEDGELALRYWGRDDTMKDDFDGERGRAFRRAALIAALVLSWAVYAGWAPPPSLTMPVKKGQPAKSSARVSWQSTP